MRKSLFRTLEIIVLILAGGLAGARAQDDVVLKAMRDEMARTMKQLQLENLQKPYFVAYEVRDLDTATVAATLGALTSSENNHSRWLSVQVRVGDYNLDNTNFVSMSGFAAAGVMRGFGNMAQLPLGDDYREIRRQIWLATDGAYKKAVQDLARKRAALENKTRGEEIPDFSKEAVYNGSGKPASTGFDSKRAEDFAQKLSASFRGVAGIQRSSVSMVEVNEYSRYLNSEGTEFTRATPYVGLTATARAQASDGLPLSDGIAAYAHSMNELSFDQLAGRVREMEDRLTKLMAAPLVARYIGPVLFEGQASAEIFAQAFVPKLVASRRPIADNPAFEMIFSRAQSPFQERIGARVLPDWASLTDDATVADYQGQALLGSYAVDDEGVRAGKTSLVENG
ncbi:MAG TPA: metallopeptidase TldD-related protein, partial [Terriglobia bacterium]|nr:metallopeptidase TldD-related protein [Terriglobia bacterium]